MELYNRFIIHHSNSILHQIEIPLNAKSVRYVLKRFVKHMNFLLLALDQHHVSGKKYLPTSNQPFPKGHLNQINGTNFFSNIRLYRRQYVNASEGRSFDPSKGSIIYPRHQKEKLHVSENFI